MKTLRLLACLLALLPALPAWSQAQCIASLRLASVPEKRLDSQQHDFQPLIRPLSDGPCLPVQLVPTSSYAWAIHAVVSGGVHLAIHGPAARLQALQRYAGVQQFATALLARG